jgi:hypothetical protein
MTEEIKNEIDNALSETTIKFPFEAKALGLTDEEIRQGLVERGVSLKYATFLVSKLET